MAEPHYSAPSSVRRQAEESERLIREAQEAAAASNDSDAEKEVVDNESNAPADPPPKPDDQDNKAQKAPFDPATATAEQLRVELEKAYQRNSTLQGKYRAEVPRLNTQVSELKAELKVLREKLADLPGPEKSDTPDAFAEHPSYQYFVDEFGPEAAEHMLSLARATQTPPTKTATTHQSDTDPQEGDETPEQAHQKRLVAMQEFVDDILWAGAFAEIDNDPDFHQWLDENDLREGTTRKAALNRYFHNGDIHRAAGFWSDWANLNQRAASAPNPDPRELLIENDTSNPGADDPAPGAEFIRASEVNQFYKDVSLGKYRGRDDEYKQREAEIMAATSAGRIIEDERRVSR